MRPNVLGGLGPSAASAAASMHHLPSLALPAARGLSRSAPNLKVGGGTRASRESLTSPRSGGVAASNPPLEPTEAFATISWLRSLSLAESVALFRRGSHRHLKRYSVILAGAHRSTTKAAFFVILRGRVRCEHPHTGEVAIRGPGECVGEGAVALSPALWPEAASAQDDCHLLQLERSDLDSVGANVELLRRLTLAQYLEGISFFRDLRHHKRVELGGMLSVRHHLKAGAVLFRETDEHESFFIIFDGRVGLFRGDGIRDGEQLAADGCTPFAELTGGRSSSSPWVGAAALWEQHSRRQPSTAVVLAPALLLEVPPAHCLEFVRLLPGFQQVVQASSSTQRAADDLLGLSSTAGPAARARGRALPPLPMGDGGESTRDAGGPVARTRPSR